MRLNKFVFSCLLSIIFLGCFRTYEVYEFKSVEQKFEWGIIGVKLIGKEKLVRNTIIKGSPYELLIWFDANEFKKGTIQIKNMDLRYLKKENNVIPFKRMNVPEKSFKKYSSDYSVYFMFNDINIEYTGLRCNISFLLNQDGKTTEHQCEFILKTDFKKFNRIIGV